MCSCLPSLFQPVILPSASVLSPPTCFFFLPTLPTVSPSLFLCSSPSQIVLSPSLFFFPPICFLFSAVSGTALLCFSSSDPTLKHLREIRRKLASENLQLEAPVPYLLSRPKLSNGRTFGASWCLPEERAVGGGAGLDSLCDVSVSSEFPCTPTPLLQMQGQLAVMSLST